MALSSDLASIRDNYVAALLTDSAAPQPSYSIDGQQVSRQEWRNDLLTKITELGQLINAVDPYIVNTKVVL